MPDEWGDTWNDPGAGTGYDYSGWGNASAPANSGWSFGGTLGGILGGLAGFGTLGPVGGVLGAKGGYAAGNAVQDALGGFGGLPSPGEMGFTSSDRASEDRYLQALGIKPAAKAKLPLSQMIGLPADYDTMTAAQKAALVQERSQRKGLKNDPAKPFMTKSGTANVVAVGVNPNTQRRVFADEQGNLYGRKKVKKGALQQVAEGPPPTAPAPTAPTAPQQPGYYDPLGGTPPVTPHGNAYGPDQPTPDWGYTPADIEYMYRASGLGHLVDGGFGVEKTYFPNDPSFQIANSGRFMKKADGGLLRGPGTGTSDSIPALVSNGEFIMTADAVRGFGGGDTNRGASALQMLMKMAERKA